MNKRARTQARIDAIGKRYARRSERNIVKYHSSSRRPFVARERKPRSRELIAYDLETTRIAAGIPDVKYLTAYGADFQFSGRLDSLTHLREILETRFLDCDRNRCRYVAWNGNHFDAYFVALALLENPRWEIRPYLNASKVLRGLRVADRESVDDKGNYKISWEFLDGISMLGLIGMPLEKFLKIFAPDYRKLKEAIDFDYQEFDSDNPEHVRYAERDSEGLYHAMQRAQKIMFDRFGMVLQPTIGNLGIKVFAANMPSGAICWPLPWRALTIIREHVMRGGYVWCAQRYRGPVWKYDINQAYAAAMREADLPCGAIMPCRWYHPLARAAIYQVNATNAHNRVPFYCADEYGQKQFCIERISRSWVTSIEYEQLRRENWKIEIIDGYIWSETFRMKRYVDGLEAARAAAEGGPSGAEGLMIKAVGNNSYGKTVEQLGGLEIVLSAEQPDGYACYRPESVIGSCLWFKFAAPMFREYHQPQIGAFITAHVRMVLRRAILKDVDAWIYSDTDCVMFSKPVALDIDAKRYGAFKIECEGDRYVVIDKKVYAKLDGTEKHAKGLNIKPLSVDDFELWYAGTAPFQKQIQRTGFVKVLCGKEMFTIREKTGSKKLVDKRRKKAEH